MIIGIDFDNTIINYDGLFILQAVKKDWLCDKSLTKKEVKQNLIAQDFDDKRWQILQAEVYGKQIVKAKLYAGVYKFIQTVIESGGIIYIISHKTEYSNFDGKTNLIQPAIKWLKEQKIIGSKGLLAIQNLSFHTTRDEKIKKIRELKCDLFIDDLSAVLLDNNFPQYTFPLLFSNKVNSDLISVNKWKFLLQFYCLSNEYNLSWLRELIYLQHSLVIKISLLNQGGNNSLRVIYFQNGEKYIVKWARTEKSHCLKNEYNALSLLNKYSIKGVAKPLLFSKKRAELIQSYLPGKRIRQIKKCHIDGVIKFILSLENLDQNKIKYINIGVHRNKLIDYVNGINTRWGLINKDIISLSERYSTFNKMVVLLNKIKHLKEYVFEGFNTQILHYQLNLFNEFPEQEMIFNPSDFGFHNILESYSSKQGKELYFLDFEYFVYDDKAKMVCDFIHHAGYKLTIEQKLYFIKQLNKQNFFTPALKQRIQLLINMIGFEWLLIILNIAQKDKLDQKIHANPMLSVEQIVETQYYKAKKLFSFYQKNINNKKELFTLGIDFRELTMTDTND
ncbi:MAG: hypothetical protein KZQ83_06860 [gamma proteobacterium symbiont of Taylorina sp.]|nr:hypothetical protein [gamma proteobacterium symbiont of Taylorina sp.]